MELSEAIERLKKFDCTDCKFATCEQCEINYGEVQAIKIVLEALEITQAKEEVAFEQGYRKGKDKGQQEGLQCGYGMGLQAKLKGVE